MTLFTKITALAITSVALAAPIAEGSSTSPLTAAQTVRLGAQTEAQGFKGIDTYLRQRYAEQTAQAGAETEATSFKGIDRYLEQRYAAQTAQAGAETEATGFKGIDRYLKQRYAEQTAQAGAETEAAGFKHINRYLTQRYGTVAPSTTSVDGFRWMDAGIGAAVTAGIAFLALAGALVIRNRRHPNPGLPV